MTGNPIPCPEMDIYHRMACLPIDFLDLNKTIKSSTVIVQMMNGNLNEYPNIQNPWQYIAKCKKNPDVNLKEINLEISTE